MSTRITIYNLRSTIAKSAIRKQTGFTLIELLVVSGILVAISGIIGGILASTLRGTETTKTKTTVAQQGNFAMTSMSETIKRAKKVTDVYTSAPSGSFTDCTGTTPPEGTNIALEMSDGNVVLTCDNGSGKIASSSAGIDYMLITDDLRTVAGSCRIVCTQSSTFSSPRIEIKYDLGKDDGSGGTVDNTEETFRTQINVRNFGSQ